MFVVDGARRLIRVGAVACASILVLTGCGSQEWTPDDSLGVADEPVTNSPAPPVNGPFEDDEIEEGAECESLVGIYIAVGDETKIRQISDPPALECFVSVPAGEGGSVDYIFMFDKSDSGAYNLTEQRLYPAKTSSEPAPSAKPSKTPKPKPSKTPKPKPSKTPETQPKKSTPAKASRSPKPVPTVTVTAEADDSSLLSVVSAALDIGEIVSVHVTDKGKYPASVHRVSGVAERLGSLKVKSYEPLPSKNPNRFTVCVTDGDGSWALFRSGPGLVGFGSTDSTCKGNL